MKGIFCNCFKKFDNITVVVQGSYSKKTVCCVNSIKKHLPGSKIILSTWEGAEIGEIDQLGLDLLILNKDPGFTYYQDRSVYPDAKINNVNRQIVSTKSGLAHCSTEYALKLRSDFILKGNGFMGTINKFPKRSSHYQIFKERITTFSILDNTGVLFSPCDWIFLGRTEDLNDLFSIPLMASDEAEYISKHMYTILQRGCFNQEIYDANKYSVRYIPENYIFYSALRNKYHEIDYDNYTDLRVGSRLASEEALINNFVVYDFEVAPLKKNLESAFKVLKGGGGLNHGGWLNKKEWRKLYEKYTQ